jgi:hypothetical protein
VNTLQALAAGNAPRATDLLHDRVCPAHIGPQGNFGRCLNIVVYCVNLARQVGAEARRMPRRGSSTLDSLAGQLKPLRLDWN